MTRILLASLVIGIASTSYGQGVGRLSQQRLLQPRPIATPTSSPVDANYLLKISLNEQQFRRNYDYMQNNQRRHSDSYGTGSGGAYGGGGTAAYGNGGYMMPFGYQPYSYSLTPSYGGAVLQGTGGAFTPWGYQPYTYGGFVPSYGFGFGGGY